MKFKSEIIFFLLSERAPNDLSNEIGVLLSTKEDATEQSELLCDIGVEVSGNSGHDNIKWSVYANSFIVAIWKTNFKTKKYLTKKKKKQFPDQTKYFSMVIHP